MQYNYEPFFDPKLESDYILFYEVFKEDNYHDRNRREQEISDDPRIEDKYEEWVDEENSKATKLFLKEYDQFVSDGIYFYGCPHDLYLKTYHERLDSFLKYYPEANEMHFIKFELKTGVKNIRYFISDRERTNMSFSLDKRYNYLNQRASSLGFNITLIDGDNYDDDTFKISKDLNAPIEKNEYFPHLTLKWNGSNVQAAEIIKALIEMNMFEPDLTDKEIFDRFSCFFGKEIKQTIGIRDFSKRVENRGNLTLFLDKLKDALFTWYNRKEENNRYI